MKIKETNGKVKFITKAGDDYVKSIMNADTAKKLISAATPTKSEKFGDFSIRIKAKGQEYYFEAAEEKSDNAKI